MSQLARLRIRQTALFTSLILTGLVTVMTGYSMQNLTPPDDIRFFQHEDGRIHLTAKGINMKALVDYIGARTGIAFELDEKLAGQKVHLELESENLEALIKTLSGSSAIVFERDGAESRIVSARITSQQEQILAENRPGVYAANNSAPAVELPPWVLSNAERPASFWNSRNSKYLMMQNARIDTTEAKAGRSISIPSEWQAQAGTTHHIVQFDRPISEKQKSALRETGASISHYVPKNALAVKATSEQLEKVKAIDGVYYVEAYHPYFKLNKDLVQFYTGNADETAKARAEKGQYNIVSFRNEDSRQEITSAGYKILNTQSAGGRTIYQVEGSLNRIADMAKADSVLWVEPTPERKPMNDLSEKRVRAKSFKTLIPGLKGEGVVVAVTDSGIDFKHPGFAIDPGAPTSTGLNTRIKYYDYRSSFTADGFPGDNNGHGSHVAGSILGNGALSHTVFSAPGSGTAPFGSNTFAGVAPKAQIVVIEDFNSFTDEEQAEISWNQGARISNNSWGASVFEYGALSMVWDELVRDAVAGTEGRQELIAFFAAGNDGGGADNGTGGDAGTVGQPGNAKNVISVGAVELPRRANNLPGSEGYSDSDWQVAAFSSRGPVTPTDLRVKPDVVAPGTYVLSVQSSETLPDDLLNPFDVNWDYRAGNVNSGTNYAFFSGTSMATPIAAGAGALFYQYFTNTFGISPSPALMKAAMVAGARMLNSLVYNYPTHPSLLTLADQGWGLIDISRSALGSRIQSTDQILLLDQNLTAPVATDEYYARQIVVGAGQGSLKVVLAWSDAPGTVGNEKQLVNDIDLIIQPPGGGGYLGNLFALDGVHSERLAIPDPIFGDQYNNVEVITIKDPPAGTYTIQVYGYEVVTDDPQDFALVIMKGIGIEGRTAGDSPSIALDTNDFPVVAYSAFDDALNRQVFLKRWIGEAGDLSEVGEWKRLEDQWFGLKKSASDTGVSLSLENTFNPSVAVASSNIYVAWEHHGLGATNIFVRQFNGKDWIELDDSAHGLGISKSGNRAASEPIIKVLGNGQPVVAWLQAPTGASRRVFVRHWTGTNWAGFANSETTGVFVTGNTASAPELTINSLGNPVVAWHEALTGLIYVREWNGATWTDRGTVGVSVSTTAKQASLAAGPSNVLFLAWDQSFATTNKSQIYAARNNGGTTWNSMAGSSTYPGISDAHSATNSPNNPKIGYSALPSPRLLVAWVAGTNEQNSVLVKQHILGGTNWTGVGGAGQWPGVGRNDGVSSNIAFAVSPKAVPNVAFQNNGSGQDEIFVYQQVLDINPPTFAGLKTAVGGTNNNVNLTWLPGVDNFSTSIVYRIYQGTNTYNCFDIPMCSTADVFSVLIAEVTNSTSFQVTGVSNYLLRCYAVRAVDSGGFEDNNNVLLYAAPTQAGISCDDLDTDSDGLPDWWEFIHFGSTTGGVAAADEDGDTLTNLEEFQSGIDPFNPDSDSDGLTDDTEVNVTLTSPASADTDEDGLDDNIEVAMGSDPRDADSNNNGVSDGDMVRLGFTNVVSALELFNRVYIETFEANSPSRTNWTKSVPNQAYPLNFWHLSDAIPETVTNGIVRINDRSTNTSYRMAIDLSIGKTNVNATYAAGTNRWVAGLDSPIIDASSLNNLFISWKEFYDLESNKDFVELHVRSLDFPNWKVISIPKTGSSGDWEVNLADLSEYAGQSNVQVRFLFNADNLNNAHRGWYVDDVVFYSGLQVDPNSWVRDINGCPVQGATVSAIGVGIITNTVSGHKIVSPGKVFGSAFTDKNGAYTIRGLPAGAYIYKVDHPSYRSEFWNGALYSPSYAFGNGLNPGVFTIDLVGPGGIVAMSTNVSDPIIEFELEPGDTPSHLGVAAPVVENVSVNFDYQVPSWNGSTSAPAVVDFQSITNLNDVFNAPHWDSNAVVPNYLTSLLDGDHWIGLSSNRWSLSPAVVAVRAGEYSRVGLATNTGMGFMYVAALDGIVRKIWVNGIDTGSSTPALLKLQAGQHLVQIANDGNPFSLTRLVQVPIGGRTNVGFKATDQSGSTGSLNLQSIDRLGNDIDGASVFLNGREITTNSVPSLSSVTTPIALGDLIAGNHILSFQMDGFKITPPHFYGILADDSTFVLASMFENDLDFDRVGDATEINSFTNRFVASGSQDTDADGMTNAQEFEFTQAYNVVLDPQNFDTDGDGLTDGNEIGFDGYLTNGSHIMYARTTLSTNAIEDSDFLRLRFTGRYLDGIWNFGSASTVRLSVEGDIVESPIITHTAPAVPSNICVETVLTGIPSNIISKAINRGQPVNTRVFADTDPAMLDTDLDTMWDGFEFDHQFITNVFLQVSRILDPIGAGNTESDPEGDGLNNYYEFLGRDGIPNLNDSTSPTDHDSDGDLMPDGWEYFYGLDAADPEDADLDGDEDLLPNVYEYIYGTSPLLYDTDADGLSDGEEVLVYGSNPANPDSDDDGLFDGLEVLLGANPNNWDTDGDGMSDGYEVLDNLGNLRSPDARLNPLDGSDADDDYDGDGLTNLQEFQIRDGVFGHQPDGAVWDYPTDPFIADSDGDGMPDGWEVYHSLHPLDPVTDGLGGTTTRHQDLSVSGDVDGDGLWNLREFNIKFFLDPSSDTNGYFGFSTDPRDVDTDDDGLWDGEEDRVFRTNPHLQDSDEDRLFDGAALDPRWGEVESSMRVSHFELVSCPTCTWKDAEAMAQIPHPDYTNIIGHLATFPSYLNVISPELFEVENNLLSGTEDLVAIGGSNSNGPFEAFTWIDNAAFFVDILFVSTSNYVEGIDNYLALGTNTPDVGKWITITSTQLISHFLIEWDDVPAETNHYDRAMNDLWRLRWPDTSDLPVWERVTVAESSEIPPARWGNAITYNPVFETKNPRDDYIETIPTKILMDNRQVIVVGGTDGVTKYRDVWEYVVRSNAWVKSISPLNDLPPAFFDGLSEMSAVTMFINKNTGCESFDDRTEFGYPKSRPWSDSRSFDWTYFFGGWDRNYAYTEAHAFYKSTDDPRPIEESKNVDVGVAEFFVTNAIAPNLLVAESTDGDFLIGNSAIVDNDVLQPYSAFQIEDFALKDPCDYIVSAILTLSIDFNNAPAPFDISVFVETKNSLDHSDPEYNSDVDISEPSSRLNGGGYTIIGPVNATVPTGVSDVVLDVTGMISNLLFDSGNWDATILGFIITNNLPSGFARVDIENSFISVTYIPSYKIEPYWDYPSSISYLSNTKRLSQRKSSGLAFDYTRQKMVQFGGIDGNTVFGETYEGEVTFTGGGDPNNVSWVQQVTANSPSARWGHSMIYDHKNERIVLFGGFDSNHIPLNDLWFYTPAADESTPASWTQITEFKDTQRPMPRGGASVIWYGDFDYNRGTESYSAGANKQHLVLFGGTDGKTYFNDTWVYDDESSTAPGRWILVNPVGEQSQGPEPRAFASMVFTQNGRVSPDPLGDGEYRASRSPPSAAMAAYLFGGRTGTLPRGTDTDHDMVSDGVEHALGGTAAGRDPRINKLIYVDDPTETIPFAIKRLGSKASDGISLRGAVANFESLRHDDGIYAIGNGLPWEVHVDPDSEVGVSGGAPEPGVDALLVDQLTLWYHRYAYGDPNDERDVWDLGVPNNFLGGNVAPPYAYSGRWVYGTRLDGQYPHDAVMDLYSPVFNLDLPSLDSTSTNNPNSFFLVFHEWLDLADANDYVQIDVVRPTTPADAATRVSGLDKTDITVLGARNFAFNTTNKWRSMAVPLNITANEQGLFLRFRLSSDSELAAGGWYIDDVAIVQGGEISGVLTNFGPGFIVNLHGENDGYIINEGITSENGEFGFGLLPSGNYYLSSLSSTGAPIVVGDGLWVGSAGLPQPITAFSLVSYSVSLSTVMWEAAIGQDYQVQYADTIFGPWIDLGAPVTAVSNPESLMDPGPIPGLRFYRVILLNQP